MASRTRALAAAALAAATLAAGCGDAVESHEEGARATAETYLDLCAHERYTAALHLLGEPARERFLAAGSPADGCRAVMQPTLEALVVGADDGLAPGETRVAAVRVDGDYAVADVDVGGTGDARLHLHSRGPEWTIFSPAP